MDLIYQKKSNLDVENNFTIELSKKKKTAEKEKFNGGDEYLLSSLDLKLKDKDMTKWTEYKRIEALSNLINATKTKNLPNIDLTMW